MGLPLEIKMEPRIYMDISQSNEKILAPNDSLDNGCGFQHLISVHENFSNRKEDLQVDVIECANSGDDRHLEEEAVCQDVANSSSFDDSICAPDGSGFDDEEAESSLCEDYPLPSVCDGTEFFSMRKKKLTDEWRRFIRPIMWRCKWLELKVKEFQSQARKYEKEIAEYYLTKQFELEKSKLEGYDAKSLPLSFQTQRVKVLKRRKRKRVEETTDVGSYMSSHSLFSYTENRTPVTVSPHYRDLDGRTTKAEDEVGHDYLVPEFEFSDNLLAGILRKIDEARTKAQRLKRRVDELMCEYSLEILTDHSPPSTEIGDCVHLQSSHTEDLLMPQTVASSQRDVMIQNSGQPLIRITFGDVNEETEMNDDEATKQEELDYFKKVIDEVTAKPRLLSEEPREPKTDTPPVTRSNRVTTRKRKRQPSWVSTSSSSRRRSTARRRKTSR